VPKYRIEKTKAAIAEGQDAVVEIEADEISLPSGIVMFGNNRTIDVVGEKGEKTEGKGLELVAVFNMGAVLSVMAVK
jgi:hypothetical protein